jgi:hypothetical protein
MQTLCKPALVYIIVETVMNLYLLLVRNLGILHFLFKLVFVIIWVVVLQIIYIYIGWETFTWIIVVIPILIYIAALLWYMEHDMKKTIANNFYIADTF